MVAFRMDICGCKEVTVLNGVAQITVQGAERQGQPYFSGQRTGPLLPSPRDTIHKCHHFFLGVFAGIHPGAIAVIRHTTDTGHVNEAIIKHHLTFDFTHRNRKYIVLLLHLRIGDDRFQPGRLRTGSFTPQTSILEDTVLSLQQKMSTRKRNSKRLFMI